MCTVPTLVRVYNREKTRRIFRVAVMATAILVAPVALHHQFVLEEAMRNAGVSLGSNNTRFVDKLLAGKPISAGIIGASVAQNAGCFDQPGRRCMDYRGVSNVTLVWGEPRSRPFKGFLVRWMEWLNGTWPHAGHALTNNGRDAQPIWAMLPCIYAYVPPKADLVFLEIGSMPYSFDPARAEAVVRRLLSIDPQPTIVFVTITTWCTCLPLCRNIAAYGLKRLPNFKSQTLLGNNQRPFLENSLADICRRYSLTCISIRRAIGDAVLAERRGFSISDVAGDCLHPTSGKHGVDYMTEMVIHWTQAAVDVRRRQLQAAHAIRSSSPPLLPEPIMHRSVLLKEVPGACYILTGLGSRGVSNGQSLLSVPWHTASCPDNQGVNGTCKATTLEACAKEYADKIGCAEWDALPPNACPPPKSVIASLYASPPGIFWFCGRALSPSMKQSPGVVALSPGAQLWMPLDIALSRAAGSTFMVALLILRSYEGMGIANVRCVSGCSCASHRIDGHRTGEMYDPPQRNESTYKEVNFAIDLHEGSAGCLLALRVSEETSSGGHKFKIRSITARQADRCETRDAPKVCNSHRDSPIHQSSG